MVQKSKYKENFLTISREGDEEQNIFLFQIEGAEEVDAPSIARR
jgi:hypothetical protein